MKLNLLFIVMDLLTVLAYPIVYVHGRLRQYSKPKENMKLVNLLVTGSITPGDNRFEIMNMKKKGIYAYSND